MSSTRVTINLRKRRNETTRPPVTKITIRIEDLHDLLSMKQVDAARHLGVSLTALKNASKQLGVDSWPRERSSVLASKAMDASGVLQWFDGRDPVSRKSSQLSSEGSKLEEKEAANQRATVEKGHNGESNEQKVPASVCLESEGKSLDQAEFFLWDCRSEELQELMEEGMVHVLSHQ
ncbi:hypothetical protein GUITHDRAFT_120430 [Guillardia theta CCMP2712]|uniref:RWP-RK domain-containing protein n=1 Tax=Guillardia theta (strain CCMP2712) TaxID=905079 RepID=L1IBC4_GUITC|nr:hypothetical protein GUITHDRAFT_120430 [Guillardia theta CCMP2712]EKX33367.1 hypothetical protein GUITHDRAFT_120430 [Guillardia theta CCMP2712]|eukprot:XP_005820347.1 hypothetical protein GUITHDRAFT_120430 [Guillardia theta CCMP2712]